MKVVVVTGASSGIGFATSKAFAAKGDCVVLASRDLHKLQNTVPVKHSLLAICIAKGCNCVLEFMQIP